MIAQRKNVKNPFGSGRVYDYGALESFEEFRALTDGVTFIGAVDLSGRPYGIVYGTETIRAIAAGIIPNQRMVGVVFAVDFSTDRFRHLCAAVRRTKGYHEWEGSAE